LVSDLNLDELPVFLGLLVGLFLVIMPLLKQET